MTVVVLTRGTETSKPIPLNSRGVANLEFVLHGGDCGEDDWC